MTAEKQPEGSEMLLIARVLTIADLRMTAYQALTGVPAVDPTFTERRLSDMATALHTTSAALVVAQHTIAALQELIDTLRLHPIPAELCDALRARPGTIRGVRLTIGSRTYGIAIAPIGRVDPIEEARYWRRLVEHYGTV